MCITYFNEYLWKYDLFQICDVNLKQMFRVSIKNEFIETR